MNALERVKREKVRVTGDDVGGMAADGELEELVVLGVPASGYPRPNVDPLSLAGQSCEKRSDVFLIDVLPELLSIQNFIEFGECRDR